MKDTSETPRNLLPTRSRSVTRATLPVHFADSDELCGWVRETTGDTVLLAFSCGKDAVAAWLQLRRHFKRIVPFYRYIVPGLRIVDEAIAYYEDFFETPILQVPHPSLYRMLNALVFQPPERCATIEAARLPVLNYEEQADAIRRAHGAEGAYLATGVRAADSPLRRRAVKRHGPISHKRRTFMSVFDWKKDRLIDELTTAGAKLPRDYDLFGRSFDGIDYRFLQPLKERAPDDYARVLEWFPLADLGLMREAMIKEATDGDR